MSKTRKLRPENVVEIRRLLADGQMNCVLAKRFGVATWENWGSHWHIDHIRPLVSFDLLDVEQQRVAFHFTNLRPLEKKKNLQKGAKAELLI